MPNHIKNRVELIGLAEDVKLFVEKYSTHFPTSPNKSYDGSLIFKAIGDNYQVGWLNENTGIFTRRNEPDCVGAPDGFVQDFNDAWTRFPDFEKVFSVPEVIKAVGESVNSSVIDAVKNKYKTPFSDNGLLGALEKLSRQKTHLRPEDEKQFELACKAYEATGYAYWYDYNIAKWGTKWNAYDCEKLDDNIFTFDTAWSGVLDIVIEMSKSFKGVIDYKFADEDTSYNTGRFKICTGVLLDGHKPVGGSVEAYELYFECRPKDKANYKFEKGTYIYVDDDE